MPAASVDRRVASVLSRLELGLSATLTFHETMCSVVLCEINGGVGFSTVKDPGVLVHEVTVVVLQIRHVLTVVAWREG